MKVLTKLFFLLFVTFSLVLTSCTVQDDILTDDSVDSISIDPQKQDTDPPLDSDD